MTAMMLTDFHSHILPGIDDGSASVEQSIAMLKREAEQGVNRVVATPHFYPQHDSPDRFIARRAAAEARLREEMEKHSGLPELVVGAEVYFFRGISESDFLAGLTMGNNCCILLEMPMVKWTESMYRELADVHHKQGLIPVIAHVDRYIRPLQTHRIPQMLEQLPVYVQANAASFLRSSSRGMMLRLLKQDRVHLIGSDCHNLDDRAPNMAEAVELIQKHAGPEVLSRIREYEDRLLSNRK